MEDVIKHLRKAVITTTVSDKWLKFYTKDILKPTQIIMDDDFTGRPITYRELEEGLRVFNKCFRRDDSIKINMNHEIVRTTLGVYYKNGKYNRY